MMLGLKLASAWVEIRSTVFQIPSSVGGAILVGVYRVSKSQAAGRKGAKDFILRQQLLPILTYYPVDPFPHLEEQIEGING